MVNYPFSFVVVFALIFLWVSCLFVFIYDMPMDAPPPSPPGIGFNLNLNLPHQTIQPFSLRIFAFILSHAFARLRACMPILHYYSCSLCIIFSAFLPFPFVSLLALPVFYPFPVWSGVNLSSLMVKTNLLSELVCLGCTLSLLIYDTCCGFMFRKNVFVFILFFYFRLCFSFAFSSLSISLLHKLFSFSPSPCPMQNATRIHNVNRLALHLGLDVPA